MNEEEKQLVSSALATLKTAMEKMSARKAGLGELEADNLQAEIETVEYITEAFDFEWMT